MFNTNKLLVKTSLVGLLALSFMGFSNPAFAQKAAMAVDVDHDANALLNTPDRELSPERLEKKRELEKTVLGHGRTAVDNAAAKITDGKAIVVHTKAAAAVDARFTDKSLYPVDDPTIGSDLRANLARVRENPDRATKLSAMELAIHSHPTITGKKARDFMVASTHFIAELSPAQLAEVNADNIVTKMATYVQSEAGVNEMHILNHAGDFAHDNQNVSLEKVLEGGIRLFTGDTNMPEKEVKELADCAA